MRVNRGALAQASRCTDAPGTLRASLVGRLCRHCTLTPTLSLAGRGRRRESAALGASAGLGGPTLEWPHGLNPLSVPARDGPHRRTPSPSKGDVGLTPSPSQGEGRGEGESWRAGAGEQMHPARFAPAWWVGCAGIAPSPQPSPWKGEGERGGEGWGEGAAAGARQRIADTGAAASGAPPAPALKVSGLTAACWPTPGLLQSHTPSVNTVCSRAHCGSLKVPAA